jgi:hypothetical protein
MPKSWNSRLNSEEPFPRKWNETIASIARQQLGEPLSTTVNPDYRGIAGMSDNPDMKYSSETLGVSIFYRSRLAVIKDSDGLAD